MSEDEKRALVLELFAQDVQVSLDAAVGEKHRSWCGLSKTCGTSIM
jgi:hypothetical protein